MAQPSVMGVILAAGEGVRMAPLSAQTPKPLLPVLNRPLIVHHLGLMQTIGIEDVLIVVGRLGAEIEAYLGDGSAWGVRIRYVPQDEPRGIAHAVSVVEPYVDRPFLLILGDVYFEAEDLRQMLEMESQGFAGVLAAIDDADLEALQRNFAIVRRDDGSVSRVIEKPRHPPTRLEGCGVYLFDLPFFDAIRRTPRSALRDEYEITDAIQIFIDDGHRIGVAEVVEHDVNITFPRDVWELNLRELARSGRDVLVDESATITEGATIHRAVIGPGAHVGAVVVEEAVVLAGARVEEDARRCIVTPEGRVSFEEDE